MKQEKNLPCKLTPSELLDRADQLVDCAKKSEEVELEKKGGRRPFVWTRKGDGWRLEELAA